MASVQQDKLQLMARKKEQEEGARVTQSPSRNIHNHKDFPLCPLISTVPSNSDTLAMSWDGNLRDRGNHSIHKLTSI